MEYADLHKNFLGKFGILSLQNSMQYVGEKFDEEGPIVKETSVNFYNFLPFSSQATYKVRQGVAETDDNPIMSISGFTGLSYDYFTID